MASFHYSTQRGIYQVDPERACSAQGPVHQALTVYEAVVYGRGDLVVDLFGMRFFRLGPEIWEGPEVYTLLQLGSIDAHMSNEELVQRHNLLAQEICGMRNILLRLEGDEAF